MAKVGAPTDKGSDMSFKLKVQSGTLNFDGHVSRIAPDADVKGKVSLATGGLTDFITSLMRAGGQAAPGFDATAIGPFAFDGDIDLSARKLALTDFRMSVGTESVSGSVTLVTGPNPSLESRLSLPKVDAEKWLALLSDPKHSGRSRPQNPHPRHPRLLRPPHRPRAPHRRRPPQRLRAPPCRRFRPNSPFCCRSMPRK